MIFLSILILFMSYIEVMKTNPLDNGTIYVPENSDFELKCQNKTEGEFANLIWRSNTYSAQKVYSTFYSYYRSTQTYIRTPYFKDRLTRINGTSVRITKASMKDSGRYECNIIFQYKKGNNRIKVLAVYDVVVVSSPSVMVAETQLLSASVGDDRSVYCEVQGLSPFVITWVKVDSDISDNVQFTEEESKYENYFIKRNFMKFKNMSGVNTGRYQCIARNLGGEIFKQVYVKMMSAPVINSDYRFFINVEQSGELRCEAKGYPLINFKWKFMTNLDPIVLRPLESWGRFSVSHTEYDTKLELGSSRLTVINVEKEDFKTYTCIAENEVDFASKRIQLEGLAPPDPPVIVRSKVESYTDKIILFWEYGNNGGQRITSITIEYRNSTNLKWSKITNHQYIASYAVTNLDEGIGYEFRLSATNSIGSSEYSKPVRISTESTEIVAQTQEADLFGSLSLTSIIGIFAGAFIVLIIVCILACIFIRKIQKTEQNEMSANHNSNSYGGAQSLQTQVDGGIQLEMEALLTPADEWEFPRDRLTISTVLGQGAFGIVMRGQAQGIKGSLGQVPVAVKMVRDNQNEIATRDLLAELNLLKLIPEHPNVVGLLGCCTRSEPLYVIVEYCSNGDLQGFLRSSRGIYERYYRTSYGGAVPDLTSKMLLTFAWQITKGMAHLAAMKVIHRDLAARNILVDDQLVCKISDFGFARDIYIEDHYLKRSAGGRFPIKWMAIESLLDGISTTKSDVWAYGVVLWELVTLGASPYPGMNSYEVVSFLQDGYRMDKPKHCSDELYELMMRCWNVSPGRRPSFNDLADICQELVESSTSNEYISMSYYQDHLYINFDINGSSMSSTATTPHGTLGRTRNESLHATLNPTSARDINPTSIRDINPSSIHDMNTQENIERLPPLPPLRTLSNSSHHNINRVDMHNNFPRTGFSSTHTLSNGTPKSFRKFPSSNGRSHSVTALSDRSATGFSVQSTVNESASLLRPV